MFSHFMYEEVETRRDEWLSKGTAIVSFKVGTGTSARLSHRGLCEH